MKILIAEDNPTNRKLLQSQLETERHTVLAATDGGEALAILRRESVDAIISDILMPRMDGYRFCYEVRKDERWRQLPFIFYTSTYTSPSDEKFARELNADAFIRKPASPEVILETLRGVLARDRRSVSPPPRQFDELGLMKEYSERLVSKLEEKNVELAQANEELLAGESRQLLQATALETAANAIIITDAGGTMRWVNPAFTRLTGYTPEEAIGQTPRLLKSGKHDAAFYAEFWKTIRSGQTWRGEFTNRCKDGSLYYDEHTVTPVRSASGAISHFVGIMHDVTARNQTEAELRVTNEKLHYLLAHSPAVLYRLTVEKQGVFPIVASDNIARLLGFDVAETLGADWWPGQIHPQDRDMAIASVAETLEHGTSRTEYRLRHKQGDYHWVEDHRRVISGSSNQPAELAGVWTDITERKRAEDVLRESERRFREMLENVRLVAMTLDKTGAVTFCNDYLLQLTGWKQEEVIGTDWFVQFIPEANPELRKLFFETVEAGGIPPHYENPIKTRSGDLREIVWSNTMLRDATGNIIGTASIGEDVTERKRAERRVAAFSSLGQKLNSAKTALQAAEIIVDTADQLFGWDACTLHLYSAEKDQVHDVLNRDTIGGRRVDASPTYAGAPPSPRARRVLQQGALLILREAPYAMSDGIPFGDTSRPSASLMFVPIRDDAKVIGLLSIQSYKAKAYTAQDLEALQALADHCGGALNRIQGAEALQTSEERFRLIAETVDEVFWMADVEINQTVYISPAYERVWRRSRESLFQNPRSFLDALHDEDREQVLATLKIQKTGQPFDHEYRIVWPDGSIRWILDRGFPVNNPNGPISHYVGVAKDITERRQLEEQFRQAQKMEAIGQLAAGVAHDFNNMLAVIHGNAEMALMFAHQPGEDAHECINQVIAASERAANLTRQLLAFGRKQVLQSQPLNLNDVISNLTKMLNRIIGENISLQCAYSTRLALVRADVGMMEQVLVNLVVNARDAMPRGGQLFIKTEQLHVDEAYVANHPEATAGELICVSVKDTGTGIAPENLSRIFEPFYTTKVVGKGTGLGLATVYGIIKQHQGWVEVATELGAGTTFKVFVPAMPPATAEAVVAPAAPVLRGGTETILLVEDDPGVRSLTRRILEAFDYRVVEAASGREALGLWKVRGAEIDLLLTDLVMPDGVTGRQLAEALFVERPSLKAIFMSGYSMDTAGRDTNFIQRIKSFFLQKPVSTSVLIQTVRQCLDQK